MEYGITAKPITFVNPMPNAILERIHQILGNLLRIFNISTQACVDKNNSWTVILSAEAFTIRSKANRQQGYSPGQLIFGRDMIIPIKHRVYW